LYVEVLLLKFKTLHSVIGRTVVSFTVVTLHKWWREGGMDGESCLLCQPLSQKWLNF